MTIIPLLCRCWSCDTCRPRRSALLVHEAKSGRPDLFVTLTSRVRPSLTADQAAQALVVAWRTIRREYLREHGKGSLPFLAVFEATKQGWPHLHIVARCKWLDQAWLSRRMADLHDSPVVDVRRVTDRGRVAHYVAKYCGKNPHRFQGVKRYWRSLDYLRPETEEEAAARGRGALWTVLDFEWRKYVGWLEAAGCAVAWGRSQAVIELGVPP